MVAWDDVCDSYFQNMSSASGPRWGTFVPETPWFHPPSISEPTTVFYKHSGIFTREHYSPQISLHSNNQFAHVVHKQNSIRLAISVWHVYTQECDHFSPWSFWSCVLHLAIQLPIFQANLD